MSGFSQRASHIGRGTSSRGNFLLLVSGVSGFIFWDTGEVFNALLFTANWFWFSTLIYLVIELLFITRYIKKYAVE